MATLGTKQGVMGHQRQVIQSQNGGVDTRIVFKATDRVDTQNINPTA